MEPDPTHALAAEFVPLNRRRVGGDPPLSGIDLERWSELRDQLAYVFGHAPPVGPAKQPRHLRVPAPLKVRFEADGAHAGTLENLSEGGAFLCSDEILPVGSAIQLEIESSALDAPLRLEALVVHARELPNLDGPAGFGLAFQELEAADHGALNRLFEAALIEALAKESSTLAGSEPAS